MHQSQKHVNGSNDCVEAKFQELMEGARYNNNHTHTESKDPIHSTSLKDKCYITTVR